VLTLFATLGNIPSRHRKENIIVGDQSTAEPSACCAPVTNESHTHDQTLHARKDIDLDTLFRVARGRAPSGAATSASDMTKWFDTNYHYLVPEFHEGQEFALSWTQIIDETAEAIALGHNVKPVILGPLSYLWLGKEKGEGKEKGDSFDRFELLDNLLPAYTQLLQALADVGATWVQIDEPILVLDLPVAGLHIDAVRAPEQVLTVVDRLAAHKFLSIGIVDGRNIWRNDLQKSRNLLHTAQTRLGNRSWIAPSCSLLNSPVDLQREIKLDADIKSWLAFAQQKALEVVTLKTLLISPFDAQVQAQ
jgi:5-methyltetrahydropteroyltriglutamate--homocysteine methyltransferase